MNANRSNQSSLGYKIAVGIFVVISIVIISYVIYNTYNNYEVSESNSPWLIKGTQLANSTTVVPAYVIKPSKDGRYGLEFSYSMWVYIDGWTYKNGEYKNILVKGDPAGELLQAPGIFLDRNENNLIINMNTFESVRDTLKISGVPVNKWWHLVVVLLNNNIDVYINGELKQRKKLSGIPRLNYNDLYLFGNGGFQGFLSRAKYFNYALPYYMIERMFREGPSKKSCTEETDTDENYLSKSWWLNSGNGETQK